MSFEIKSPLEIDPSDIEKIHSGIQNFPKKNKDLFDSNRTVDSDGREKITISMGREEIITFSRLTNGKFEVSNLQPRHGSIQTTHIVLIGLFREFTDTEIAVNP